ncbi:DUF998 domain-containing protein [Dactylosporangium sp. AC04546]|uniref:DUF998 domain-containing protein n=1 Tax=Dactylosporangium sp. AC04546 TaxID=2862460 RepID=UPI001EDF95A7|nr:DUF998 domain-containing protein [Dactylosporangium sp. AC04546]WVK86292.1 DUF998 domain-containing protein [Dactylosporangium sp. AC04546]
MTTAVNVRTVVATRPLLIAGAVAGPLFLVVVLIQAYSHDGFDPARHPLSSLVLGDQGWVQVANFFVCGLLSLAGAVGLRRAGAGTWGAVLVGAGGAGLLVAGLFQTDPINGYPVGTADTVTWHGTVHSMGPGVAGLAGLAAFVVFARRFARQGERGWLAWTIATPVAVIAADVASFAAGDFRLLLLSQALVTAWTTTLYAKMLR